MTRSPMTKDGAGPGPRDGDLACSTGTTPDAPHGAAAGPSSSAASPRGYRLGQLILFTVQFGLLTWVASRSFFVSDDLLYGSLLGEAPLDVQLLTRSWFGHLVPGFIAADWAYYRVFGLDWGVAAVVMIAVALAATVAFVRLLEALCGRAWRTLAVSALFGLSLMVLTQVTWWGAVMTNLAPLAASIATMGCFVRWVRTGRSRHLVGMTLCFLIAVAFYEKSILTAAYVGLLSVLVLDAGLPWHERVRSMLRRWPAWVVLGGVALLDVGWYLTHDYILEAGPAPGARAMGAFLLFSFTEGFAPSFLGMHQPGTSLLGSTLLAIVVANGILLAVAALTSLRSRPALQAWVFFALGYLINQGVLGRGRVAIIGPHMGTLLRYQLENVVLFCIALAVAASALRGLWPRRWAPRLLGRTASSWAAFAVLAGLLAPYWVISLREEVRMSPGVASRQWFDTAARTLAEQQAVDPGLAVVDGVVPQWLVYAQMASYNRYERVLPQVLSDVALTQREERGLSFTEAGEAVPVRFEATADLGGAGTCLTPGTETDRVDLKLPEALPEQLWFVNVEYAAEADSQLEVILHNGAPGPDLRLAVDRYETEAGGGRLVVAPGTVAAAEVVLEVTGSSQMCLQGITIGTMQPEG
jgi:hypothetical protein